MNAGPSFSALEPHLRAFTPAHAALTRLLDGVHRGGDSDDWQLHLARTPLAASAPLTLAPPNINDAQNAPQLGITGPRHRGAAAARKGVGPDDGVDH
ncbi:hypothetical protein [Ralstonia pseudosolanacearum]|uniref:hypothetical protein n=1 Tax=Ralstonia pseudosolanacearum TaxID=1310165 RepID=UPI003CF8375B